MFRMSVIWMFSAMNLKQKIKNIYEKVDNKFLEQFGFRMKDVTCSKIVQYLHEPKDSSSLAVTRILFGLCMLFDIPNERGGADMVKRWGKLQMCHFPLLSFITPLPMPYMALVYLALWIGALGIMLGYKYRSTAPMFTVCYWYLFLIEKSYWNNHSYLFGLVAMLLSFTEANCYWSLDAYLNPSISKDTVPYWNYFILKYQFFILYFMAGVKKGTAEWLDGYSVINLGSHWVFAPFRLFLTVGQVDYLIVHWFIFFFDLTVAFWMMWEPTRNVSMVFCAMFHLMNSRLFRIGMFPWVCLATMPLYYPFDWPKKVIDFMKKSYNVFIEKICELNISRRIIQCICSQANKSNDSTDDYNCCETNDETDENDDVFIKPNRINAIIEEEDSDCKELKKGLDDDNKDLKSNFVKKTSKDHVNKINSKDFDKTEDVLNKTKQGRRKLTTIAILFYMLTQAFLPFSHFITEGYNNWTNGLYGYSWDMMVHSWDVNSVVIKVVDNIENEVYYLDPYAFTPNDRWVTHGDMVQQYAYCIKNHLEKSFDDASLDISIYIDVWNSLNGRFTQRMYDPNVDLLETSWSVFERVPFLFPMLDDEALNWRTTLLDLKDEVMTWGNNTEVLFVAEFPGFDLWKYVGPELTNITLTILKGRVSYEAERDEFDPNTEQSNKTDITPNPSQVLTTGQQMAITSGRFHRILNIGDTPAFYMISFVNTTASFNNKETKTTPALPIFTELNHRFEQMFQFGKTMAKCIYEIFAECSKCKEYMAKNCF